MSKTTWFKWGLLLAGSTVAALGLGSWIAEYVVTEVILKW